MPNNIYALLIGIDHYLAPAVPPLRGCVNDVQAVYALLVKRLGVPAENIKLLVNEQATRANIIHAWREQFGTRAGAGDYLFFQFSGHGSQARSADPAELDGFDETLVAYDSRDPGQYDILDKELAHLIGEVEQKSVRLTVLLDCCHSGSGTRAGGNNRPLARQCERDLRQRPFDTLITPTNETASTITASCHWLPTANPSSQHVLLAACRDEELANEYRAPEVGQWHGAVTYFFLQTMQEYHPGLTWAALYDLIYAQVRATYPAQSPQLEGPSDWQIFGNLVQESTNYLLVLETNSVRVKISGGAAVGLRPGGRVALYSPASNGVGKLLTLATVDEVTVDQAWATLDQPLLAPVGSRVKIVNFGGADPQHPVGVDDPLVCTRIMLADQGQPSLFLKIVAPLDSSQTPEFLVVIADGHYRLEDATGTQLVVELFPVTPAGAAKLVNALEHLAIYQNVQRLRNTAVSALQGAISLSEPLMFGADAAGNQVGPRAIRQPGGELVAAAGQTICFTVQNKAKVPLYITVLRLNQANWSIQRLFPMRAWSEKLAPGRSTLPISAQLGLADSMPAPTSELFKVFATTVATAFDVLQLPALNQGDIHSAPTTRTGSALDRLLNALCHPNTRRFRTVQDDATDDQWITAQWEIRVVASPQISGNQKGIPA